MTNDSTTLKLFAIAVIGGVCFIASLAVMGLVVERKENGEEAKREVASMWGQRQTLAGPMLVNRVTVAGIEKEQFVLPHTLHYESTLVPEERTRGIFKTVVYTSAVKVSGEFRRADITKMFGQRASALLVVGITDTRGIAKQFDLTWNNATLAFEPGAGVDLRGASGLHAEVPISQSATIPFSFEVALTGSDGISVAPLGSETSITIASAWPTPKFVGNFLPTSREITDQGFTATWQVSSFGRSYPQSWEGNTVDYGQLLESGAGVDLHQAIDAYDMVFRSVKYAILFIVITFAAFFLFDVMGGIRVHPIQYLLIGASLALFYLLVLSFAEVIGFKAAYALGALMIASLITFYSRFVLKSGKRALPIFGLLAALYGYLYFVLQLEDYALLAGSLLLFMLLAVVMYATRNIDWFGGSKK